MHARRRLRSFRRPAVLLSAIALAASTVACGTANTADPTTSTPVTSSSAAPVSASGPTVTVPGLGSSSAASSSSSSGSAEPDPSSPTETTTTVVVPPSSEKSAPSSESTPETGEASSEAPVSSEPADTPETTPEETTGEDPTTSEEAPADTPDAPAETTTTPPAGNSGGGGGGGMTKKVVVIDPGHNGQNGAHPEIINQQVDAGFGEMKNCNTTGTETDDGYTESLFNWKVSLYLKEALEARGITVVMTRDSNDGVGPCVNERAAVGNDNNADAVVSVHGDGDYTEGVHGFYVMTSERDPAGPEMASSSSRLATNIRDALVGAGLPPSNSIGSDGLFKRGDLSGLNLSVRPTVMLELGNMKNGTDIALMTSEEGQAQYAQAIALGTVQFLIGR